MMTVGRHMALTLWMLALLAIVIFVYGVREGSIRDATWSRDCAILESGGAVKAQAASHDYIDRCNELQED